MCLGALIDAGLPLRDLNRELKRIPVSGYRLTSGKVMRSHLAATKVDVTLRPASGRVQKVIRSWKDVEKTVLASSLSNDIKLKGLRIFKRLFTAEAKVHGVTFNRVHLHELGSVDCLIDIFGTVIGLNMLGIEKVFSSPLNLGSGMVRTKTGMLPVPAPATAEILKKVPVLSRGVPFELTTPTGAAIIREICSGFGNMPDMEISSLALGAGSKNFSGWPNILRIMIGNIRSARDNSNGDSIMMIETNIDDMNPQVFEYVMELLYKAGALDVFLTQIIMKKSRLGTKLTALCHRERLETLVKIIFSETPTLGLRYYETERIILDRAIRIIDTEFGKIRVKFSGDGRDITKMIPEYEDCKKAARKFKMPLTEVMKRIGLLNPGIIK